VACGSWASFHSRPTADFQETPVSSNVNRHPIHPRAMPNYYDPNVSPDPDSWLLLDEQDRISQAEKYHKKRGIRLPNTKAHATFHAIIENQIAEGEDSVVRAMERLKKQGLDRHDSIHAIAWVLSQHIFEQMKAETPDDKDVMNARYVAAVEGLTADDWRNQAAE